MKEIFLFDAQPKGGIKNTVKQQINQFFILKTFSFLPSLNFNAPGGSKRRFGFWDFSNPARKK